MIETLSKPNNKFLSFINKYGFLLMIIFIFSGIISAYIDFVAIGLAELVIEGFYKLFGLFI